MNKCEYCLGSGFNQDSTTCHKCYGVGKIPLVNNQKESEYFEEVNKPKHYHKGGVDVIDFLSPKVSKERTAGFYQYNVVKYATRYLDKGTPIKDLEKAEFYLKRLIELEQEGK